MLKQGYLITQQSGSLLVDPKTNKFNSVKYKNKMCPTIECTVFLDETLNSI